MQFSTVSLGFRGKPKGSPFGQFSSVHPTCNEVASTVGTEGSQPREVSEMSHAPRGRFYDGQGQSAYWDGWVGTDLGRPIDDHHACPRSLRDPRRSSMTSRTGGPLAAPDVLGISNRGTGDE
jgi:hypothetical protein